MKFLLYLYESMSRLKINFSKGEAIMVSQDVDKSLEYVCSLGNGHSNTW
jgi:hypothetical protein